MPIVNHECRVCGATVELLLPAEAGDKVCPDCGGDLLRVWHKSVPTIRTDNTPRGKK